MATKQKLNFETAVNTHVFLQESMAFTFYQIQKVYSYSYFIIHLHLYKFIITNLIPIK